MFLQGDMSIELHHKGDGQHHVSCTNVIVQIHLKEDMSPESIDEFLRFLAEKDLADSTSSVKLIEAHKTQSTLIIVVLPMYLALLLVKSFGEEVKLILLIE
jgi:hypothetical protein